MKLSSISPLYLTLLHLSLVAYTLTLPEFARADCDLKITRAGPWNGSSWAVRHVGDGYGLRVDMTVKGTPTKPFRIKFTMANTTRYLDNLNLGPGGWWWYFFWSVDLDDQLPWSITLDPDGVSGDTNLVNNAASGAFTPVPPPTGVELYSPRLMRASETSTLVFKPGSGTMSELSVLFGVPTSHGAQRVVSVAGPPNSHFVETPPYGVPLFEIARTNVAAATFQDTNRFVVELSRVRVNPTILRTNTWADMSSLTTIWTQWISPDAMCQSADPLITSFVGQSLPANYAALLSPYDTARTLHRAVMKRLTYNSNAASTDAVGVLQNGVANSAGFAALLTASLRNVGIPARRVSGFTQGQSAWRFGVEFHLPGVEWLLADPWAGHQNDATGTYAYYFGYVSGADRFVAVDVGDAHVLPYHSFQAVQTPNWWWYGGATLNSHASQASLQPQGVLSSLNVDGQSASFDLTDAPASGSVIVETSTNLINWSPLVTNALSGNVIHYSFRTGTGDRGFYRATVVP